MLKKTGNFLLSLLVFIFDLFFYVIDSWRNLKQSWWWDFEGLCPVDGGWPEQHINGKYYCSNKDCGELLF